MPVYEYRCEACQQRFDMYVPASSMAAGIVCRHCHSGDVRRLISTFASPRGASISADNYAADTQPAMTGGCGCGGHCNCH